ncbi:MAG TPA: hypothetical protein PKW35_15465 [Nannocystaceae bacterium]|nr:hypothetical protein [Nannocystaceae bacterium]
MSEPPAPAPTPAPVSPAGSSAGWSWSVWLAKNKAGLKWIATALFTFLSALIPGIESVELRGLLAAIVAFVSKFTLDWIDFRFSDVPLVDVHEPRT